MNLPVESLQTIQWILLSLMGGLLALFLYIPGGATPGSMAGIDLQVRSEVKKTTGRGWLVFFILLAMPVVIVFFAFPRFFEVVRSGNYMLFIAIAVMFTLQALSWWFSERRVNSNAGKYFEWVTALTGFTGAFLAGTAMATLFTGSAFAVAVNDAIDPFNPSGIRWQDTLLGFDAFLDWRNVSLGIALAFLARLLGNFYLLSSLREEQVIGRLKKQMLVNAVMFFIAFLMFTSVLFIMPGYASHPVDGFIYGKAFKYFNNLVSMPLVLMAFAGGLVFILLGTVLTWFSFEKNPATGFRYGRIGVALLVTALLCLAGLNDTAFYPSKLDPQSSMTIRNSSSGYVTLVVTGLVSLFIPVIIAFFWYVRKPGIQKSP